MKTAESILARVATGDPLAIEECISAYGRLIWALARRFSSDQADAEDAVQEIFIDLWRSAARFDSSRSSEPVFVAMIARRRLIDRLRASTRRPFVEELTENLVLPAATSNIERSAEASKILGLIAELGEDRKKALLLAVCHGLTHAEVASKLRIPIGTVKTHVRRGLEQIRQKLGNVVPNGHMDAAR